MAEYIDRERLKQCFHTNVCGGNAYDELIDMQPTADVVERSEYEKLYEEHLKAIHRHTECLKELHKYRSKIDKAIEEIKQTTNTYQGFLMHEGTKETILKILKNTGE